MDRGAWQATVQGLQELDMPEKLRTRTHTYVRIYVHVCIYVCIRASLTAQLVKNLPAKQETLVRFLGQEDPLEKG